MSPATNTLPRLASLGSERTLRPLLRVACASLRLPCAPVSRWARWARCGLAVGLPFPPAVIIPRSAGIFVRPLRAMSSCCVSCLRRCRSARGLGRSFPPAFQPRCCFGRRAGSAALRATHQATQPRFRCARDPLASLLENYRFLVGFLSVSCGWLSVIRGFFGVRCVAARGGLAVLRFSRPAPLLVARLLFPPPLRSAPPCPPPGAGGNASTLLYADTSHFFMEVWSWY